MKFTDGYWQMKPYVKAAFAVEYHDHRIEPGCLRVFAPTVHQADRGSCLNSPMLTVVFTAPAPGVIRTEIIHFAGSAKTAPAFPLQSEPGFLPEITESEQELRFVSGPLEARISKEPKRWQVAYYQDGELLTASDYRNMAYMLDTRDQKGYIVEQLLLSPGEYAYGLGERFTQVIKNGQCVEMWNEDGGTSSEIAYKNIPFYVSNRGYGIFVDHAGEVIFEVGSEKVEQVQFAVQEESMAYHVFAGPGIKDVLRRYGALTGYPALPPAWSFGLWLSACFTTDYDEAVMAGFLQGMEEREIPVSVFHIDPYWMKPYEWVSLDWDRDTFPDPQKTLARLKGDHRKACLWINPYIGQKSPMFAEGLENGYLVKRTDGTVWQSDMWQAGMALVDFTNPAAATWYTDKLAALLDMGVDCFKTDFGERIPVRDIAWHDGGDTMRMHNFYTYLYNKAVFELLKRKRGQGEACLFARSATAGGQQFPVHWGGDCMASYPSMAETLRGGLSLAFAGFGFWSHDISGFESTATPDLYKRWAAFGLLSSHSRLHGSGSYRVPWLFDEQSSAVLKFFTNLKMRLMPYLYARAVEAATAATPLLRPMVMEFGHDRTCHTLELQYMLGGALLVAPIFNDQGKVEFYLPAGKWTHLLSGALYEGGRWYEERYDYFSLPLLVRENTILPVGGRDDLPDYDYFDGLSLRLYAVTEAETTVYDCRGENPLQVRAVRQGGEIAVRLSRPLQNWTVQCGDKQVPCSGDSAVVTVQ